MSEFNQRPAMAVRIVATLAIGVLLCSHSRAEDWPQWRGPERDGVCRQSGLMETFPAQGLKVLWRAETGWGWSSPVAARGRVYLSDSLVEAPQPKERLHCFDARTGERLWMHADDAAYPDWAHDPAQESGPVATPIVRDDQVYALGRLGRLNCLAAASGELLWSKDLQKDYQVEWSPGMPSPLIEGELLIAFLGGKPGAGVVAFHKDSGDEAWRALDESLTFSSPIVIDSGGQKQLIVWTQESVTSLDPANGKTWWRQALATSGDYAVSTPVFHDNRLLIGGMMMQLNSDRPGAEVLWPKSKAPARRILSHTSTALFRADYVYSARSMGELVCLDAATGKQLWEATEVTDLLNGASIHITPCGDSVLLFTNQGDLIRAQLSAAGYKEISRVHLLDPTFPFAGRNVVWPAPAYADGRIYVRSGTELICASLVVE